MAYEKTVTINEKEYNLAALTARQMRDLAKDREDNPALSGHDQNFKSVAYSLNNYARNHEAQEVWTPEIVSDLPWPVYKKLNEEVAEVSGFDIESGNPQAPPPAK
jgi:hypothetical protein